MPGITPKCLECGVDLRYDPAKLTYECPTCRLGGRPKVEEVRESRKEAA